MEKNLNPALLNLKIRYDDTVTASIDATLPIHASKSNTRVSKNGAHYTTGTQIQTICPASSGYIFQNSYFNCTSVFITTQDDVSKFLL